MTPNEIQNGSKQWQTARASERAWNRGYQDAWRDLESGVKRTVDLSTPYGEGYETAQINAAEMRHDF